MRLHFRQLHVLRPKNAALRWSIGATRRFRGLLRGDAALEELPMSRCHWQDRPNTACLVSSSCSSAPAFAPRFFQTSPRGSALALRYHFTSIWY